MSAGGELKLFAIPNLVPYCFTVWGPPSQVAFKMASNLFHPRTIDESLALTSKEAEVPGIKNAQGEWDLRGHPSRVIQVAERQLKVFAQLLDPENTPWEEARLPLVHSAEMMGVLMKHIFLT